MKKCPATKSAEMGTVHGFQIWLNTPAKEKFCDPSTVIHERENTPIVALGDAEIKVMIGTLGLHISCIHLHSHFITT